MAPKELGYLFLGAHPGKVQKGFTEELRPLSFSSCPLSPPLFPTVTQWLPLILLSCYTMTRNTIAFQNTLTPPLAYTTPWYIRSIVFSFTHDSGASQGR